MLRVQISLELGQAAALRSLRHQDASPCRTVFYLIRPSNRCLLFPQPMSHLCPAGMGQIGRALLACSPGWIDEWSLSN